MSSLTLLLSALPVPELAADPTSPKGGDIWFNMTEGKYKVRAAEGAPSPRTWQASVNVPFGLEKSAIAGTATATIVAGGISKVRRNFATRTFDGTAWTSENSILVTRHSHAGLGTTLDMRIYGGHSLVDTTEDFDGTNWSAGVTMLIGRRLFDNGGTTTSTVIFGGYNTNTAHIFNGVAWSVTGSLSREKQIVSGGGMSQLDVICVAGVSSLGSFDVLDTVEQFNGTTWSLGGNLSVAVYACSCTGSTASAIKYGGLRGRTTTETYDGSSWSLAPEGLSRADYHRASGSANEHLRVGGANKVPNVELFSGAPLLSTKTLTLPREP